MGRISSSSDYKDNLVNFCRQYITSEFLKISDIFASLSNSAASTTTHNQTPDNSHIWRTLLYRNEIQIEFSNLDVVCIADAVLADIKSRIDILEFVFTCKLNNCKPTIHILEPSSYGSSSALVVSWAVGVEGPRAPVDFIKEDSPDSIHTLITCKF